MRNDDFVTAISPFSIISSGEYKNRIFWLVEKLALFTPREVNIAFQATHLNILNEFSVHSKEITPSPDIQKAGNCKTWLPRPLDLKDLQKMVFKALRDSKQWFCRSWSRGYDKLCQIDWAKFYSLSTRATRFKIISTIVHIGFLLFVLLPIKHVCELIRNRCIKLVYIYASQHLCLLFHVFFRCFAVLNFHL